MPLKELHPEECQVRFTDGDSEHFSTLAVLFLIQKVEMIPVCPDQRELFKTWVIVS